MTSGTDPFQTGWLTALSQAWEAALHGSYPIGACVVDGEGRVLASGRNRLHEGRSVDGGVISGHDLAHAEINALLALPHTRRPDCLGWTVLSTLEPCPQCAGAVAMSGIRGLHYAAPDPWGGCAHLLTDDPYVSRRGQMRLGRAPQAVQKAALRLALVGFLESGHHPDDRFLSSFAAHRDDIRAATELLESRGWLALKQRRAPLADVLTELLGREGEPWAEAAADLFPRQP